MEKIKILLFSYTKVNLGDNLYIYMLLERYPNIDFYIHVLEEDYKKIYKNFNNIYYLEEPRELVNVDIEKYDAFIYVGGSIFMETEYGMNEIKEFNSFIKRCKEKNKKFFYMSSNFGPYQTEEYFNIAKENFSMCDGICFRDKKSYELFKSLEQVQYAPDMVFAFKFKNIKQEKKSIGISVIDLKIKENLRQFEEPYEDFIKRIIIKFAKRNYKVYLFSFCEFEGDLEAIKRIMEILPKEYKHNVDIISFTDDIESYLDKCGKMKYMVCGRFHSMILSILFKQKIYNITYSKKQDNVIEELKLFRKYQPIDKITFSTVLRKYYFQKVGANKIKKIAEGSEKQFENLDNWLSKLK